MKIAPKILLTVSLLVALLIAGLAWSLHTADTLMELRETSSRNRAQWSQISDAITRQLGSMREISHHFVTRSADTGVHRPRLAVESALALLRLEDSLAAATHFLEDARNLPPGLDSSATTQLVERTLARARAARAQLSTFRPLWQNLVDLAPGEARLGAEFASRVIEPALAAELEPLLRQLQSDAHLLLAGLIDHEASLRRAAYLRGALIASLALLLLGGVAWILHRDVLRPLRHLELAAARIRNGEAKLRFGYHRHDELGAVATAFDEMLDTLHATRMSRAELEALVSQRTTQLNQLALVATHTTNLIVISDATGRIESVNAGFERVTGYSLGEVRGRLPSEIFHGPATDPATVRYLQERIATGQASSAEVLHYGKGGRSYWLQIDTQPFRDSAGRLTHFVSVGTEITARREAEAEIESYRSRLDLALAASTTCTFDYDLATNRISLDARWAAMLGNEPASQTLPGHAVLALIHPADRRSAIERISACRAGRSADYSIDYRVRTRRDTWIWIASRGRVVGRDPSGQGLRLIGTNTDITEHKAAELAVERQLDFLATLSRTTLQLLEHRELSDVLQSLARNISLLLDVTCCELLLREDDTLVVHARSVDAADIIGEQVDRERAPLLWQAHDTQKPAIASDCSLQPAPRESCGDCRVAGTAAIPILHRGRCVGVIQLCRADPDRPFTDEDIDKALLVSRLAALTLRNARSYTEARQAVETGTRALRAREENFRLLIENIHEGYYVADRRGNFTYCNPALCAMGGFHPADVLGTSVFRLVAPVDRRRIMHQYRLWLNDPKVLHATAEFQVVARSGRQFWIEQSTDFVRDPAGHALDARNLIRDITDRKKAEAALRESEERFHAVFAESPNPIVLTTYPGGQIVEINRAGTQAFAAPREDIINRHVLELEVWVDVADRERYLTQLRHDRKVRGFETRMRRRNGEVFPALFTASLIDIAGQSYSITSIQDITEWRRAEALFRDFFSFSPDAIVIATPDGTLINANRRAQELLELTHGQLIGRHALSFIPPQNRAEMAERLQSFLREPVPFAMGTAKPGLFLQSATGRIFPIDISLSPIVTDSQHFIVAAIRDVSREREAEARLRQSQKLESLGTLAGGIAHDFNNILTGLLGFVELARHELPPGDRAATWLDQAATSGSRAKDLVQQILTFSRRNEGETSVMLIAPVVREALRLLRATIPAMVEIRVDLDETCPRVRANATQIHQIVMNLCTNAWHAVPASGGVINVSMKPGRDVCSERSPDPVPGLHLTITDNGHGMDNDTLERIFEPFFTTKEGGRGTGLGLPVVHGIVSSHGGTITVRSTVGQGTSFIVFLPAHIDPTPPAPAEPTDFTASIPRGTGQHIFVVDDDELSREALSRMLRRIGYRVTSFAEPTLALAAFRDSPDTVDLVLTDFAMPVMTGLVLAQQILALRRGLPVLLISGYVTPTQEREFRANGVRHVLHKPPTIEDLAGSIAAHIGF